MNQIATATAYGELIEPNTLKIRRTLPGSVERVWDYLTDSELRRRWLAAGEMDLKIGEPFELVWRNDDLMDDPGQKPDGFGVEHRMQSKITELDPPHRLGISWGEKGSSVTFELEPRGDDVLLTLTHRRLDPESLLGIAAGWHTHLDVLVARASNEEPEPFWTEWKRLRQDYEQRLSV